MCKHGGPHESRYFQRFALGASGERSTGDEDVEDGSDRGRLATGQRSRRRTGAGSGGGARLHQHVRGRRGAAPSQRPIATAFLRRRLDAGPYTIIRS